MHWEIIEGRYQSGRLPGTPGVVCIMLDCSGSMDEARFATLTKAFREIAKVYPRAVAIPFACKAAEMPISRFPRFDRYSVGSGNGTTGIELAIPHRPERSFIISDGGIYCETTADVEHAKVDRLTGTLTAIWIYEGGCQASAAYHPYYQDLAELARRGGGDLHRWDGTSVQEIINIVRVRRVHIHELPPEIIDHRRVPEHAGFSPTTVRIRRR